ncbi:MAG: 5'-methylthioadenosine/S-adenosylhomocysteine nucleosidase [Roseburia sp.]|nr:5'-methylthioadenosine/S-adenosylhomocysteine nucleosidase [Roseburia sp.]
MDTTDKRILIQGALESEIQYYLEQECFQNAEKTMRNGFIFYVTPPDHEKMKGRQVIIGLTRMGMTNAAVATMTAIHEFSPDMIINQGTAGAHVKELKSGDIIIGRQAVNIHSLEMVKRDFGEGMCPEEWTGMETEYIDADEELIRLFEEGIGERTQTGSVVTGILGSGDLFSKEKDRILWLHDKFDNLSEDMESFAVYAACQACGIPCAALRVISNNELRDEDYDKNTAMELQRVIWETIMR